MPSFPIQSPLNNPGALQVYILDLSAGLNGAAGFHPLVTPINSSIRLGLTATFISPLISPPGTLLSMGTASQPQGIIPDTDLALAVPGDVWLAAAPGPGFGTCIIADVPLVALLTTALGYTITGGPVTAGQLVIALQINPIGGGFLVEPILTPQ